MTEATATEAATTTVATEAAAPVTEAATAAAAPATATEAAPKTEATEARATIAGGATDDKPAAAPADWPDNWRDKFAEAIKPGDKKFRERLDRMASPVEIGKSWVHADAKISSGEFKKALPADAKPEEVTAWRKENGIPESETGYIEALKLPQGVVMGDADKPIAESFAKAALKNNWSPKQYQDAVDWYYDHLTEARAQIDERDDTNKRKAEDTLRSEWGPDFRRYQNAIGNLLETLPDDMHIEYGGKRQVGGMLLAARLPDGTLLGDHPSVLRWLANQALELNPAATIIPSSGGDKGQTVEGRLKEISDLRRGDPEKYRANRKEFEAEEIRLLEAKAQLQKRGRAA